MPAPSPMESSNHSGVPLRTSVPSLSARLGRRFSRHSEASADAATREVQHSNEQQTQTREAELIVAVFRTFVLMLAVLAPNVLGLSGNYEMPEVWLAALAGVYNILTGLSCLRPDRYGLRRSFIVILDMMLITLWLRLSGQWELFPFYYLVVVVAAMWFRVFGGAMAAIFCNFFYLLLWSRDAANPDVAPPLFTTSMALNVLVLFLVGCLVGYIAEIQERERERRLESQLLVSNYEQEIDLSAQMQPLLLAAAAREHAHLELGIAAQSARLLGGGDYADAIALSDGSALLCIADVSGKSARAQARLPMLKYALRVLAPMYQEPGVLVERLNAVLAPDLNAELYIAFCCIRLDHENARVQWCNAGHIAPLLVHCEGEQCTTSPLAVCGPPLGMFPEMSYGMGEAAWQSGDHLLLYTDGLSEALSYNGTEDGEAQVQRLAIRLAHETHRSAGEVAQDFVDLSAAAQEAADALPERLRLQISSWLPRPARPVNVAASHRDDITVVVARAKG